jgi:hypothetical protein
MAMHLSYLPRPDRVTATGVIAPYPIRQYDPVYLARKTIWPFIQGIRPVGPVWKPQPQPEEIVAAAMKVANTMGLGQNVQTPVKVQVGRQKVKIRPGKAPRSQMEAKIQQCAYQIMRGKPFMVKSAGRCKRVDPDLMQAFWRRRQAFSRGSIWNIIAARQNLYRIDNKVAGLGRFRRGLEID